MTKINLKNISINSVSNSSAVNTGVNVHHNWKHRGNSSEGFGIVEGKSTRISNNTISSDRKNGENRNG
jgi:hypothetical protein